ncbi:MAG: hypothetical protein ACKO7N_05950 [Candidatus Nitrosotenuis sp.]
MIQFLSKSTIALSTILPYQIPSYYDKFVLPEPLVLKEYQSPTMNYDPLQESNNKKMQEVMDQWLLECIQSSHQ